jgi:hypothetical protein
VVVRWVGSGWLVVVECVWCLVVVVVLVSVVVVV